MQMIHDASAPDFSFSLTCVISIYTWSPGIIGHVNSWVIAYFLGPNSFLYWIIEFTFPDAHTYLFPLIHSEASPSSIES